MLNIVDLHCDTLSQTVKTNQSLLKNSCHLDIKRALKAGLKTQFFALFSHPQQADTILPNILIQLNRMLVFLKENESLAYLISNGGDLNINERNSQLGCVLHLEGGEALGSRIELLDFLYHIGLRSIGLTWNPPNLLAGGVDASDEKAGITSLGYKVIEKVQNLNMILDLAHISPVSFYQVLDVYPKPVMVTHANAYSLCPHRRNLNDEQLKALADNGGVIGFTLVNDFVHYEGPAGISYFLDHIAYVADLIGVEHLALGSDFDGADHIVLPGVEAYQELPVLLKNRGFSNREVELILSGNATRVMKQVLG